MLEGQCAFSFLFSQISTRLDMISSSPHLGKFHPYSYVPVIPFGAEQSASHGKPLIDASAYVMLGGMLLVCLLIGICALTLRYGFNTAQATIYAFVALGEIGRNKTNTRLATASPSAATREAATPHIIKRGAYAEKGTWVSMAE